MDGIILTTETKMKHLIMDCLGSAFEQYKNAFISRETVPGIDEKRIVNGKQLCELLNITEPTLIRWRNKGKIPYLGIGGAYRYNVQEVVHALSKNQKKETTI